MDAIVMLREDHARVKKLFSELKKGDLSVVPEICDELTIHAELEEHVFYPAVRNGVDDIKDVVAESFEEHHVVKVLIDEIRSLSPSDERYKAKATVLMENVEHHVEEEESQMFPEVHAALGRKRLVDIGEDLKAYKATLSTVIELTDSCVGSA